MKSARKGQCRVILRAAASMCLLLAATHASAEASLTLTPIASTCSFITGTNDMPTSGSRECSPSVGAPVVLNNLYGLRPFDPINISDFVVTYAFTYSDDGLRLSAPVTLDVGTPTADTRLPRFDPNYLRIRTPQTVSFEAATLSLHLEGSGASPVYTASMSASGGSPDAITLQNGVLMFGLNEHPDDFSGLLGIRIGTPAFPATLSGVAVSSSVASVNAVPEPSTYALMVVGLAGIALATRRRRGQC